MLFALHTPYSTFCKDGLMMVSWPKHYVKEEKNEDIMCFIETRNYLFSFSLMPEVYLYL